VIHGCEGHVLPAARFARDPLSWFRLLAETGGTITSGPSSAWAAAVRAAERERPDVDLSALRIAIVAAEMIDPATVDRLVKLGPRVGLSALAIAGGYGMAEATLGVSLTSPGRGLRLDRVGLEQLDDG